MIIFNAASPSLARSQTRLSFFPRLPLIDVRLSAEVSAQFGAEQSKRYHFYSQDKCLLCCVVCLVPQGGDPRVEHLLLDVYGQINEPDGIYAVARSHHMASQLRLLQHEGTCHAEVPEM